MITLLTYTSELISGTSSAMILQLEENRQEIEKIVTVLDMLSFSVPSDLQQRMSEISKIKTLVSELAQFNIKEVRNISLGMSDVQERLQGGSIEISKHVAN
jgi:methyl coenzyme M reductase subunit D